MAGALTVTTIAKLTGLGREIPDFGAEDVTMSVPVKHQEGYTITEDFGVTAVQLFDFVDIALAKIYGCGILAESGTILIGVDTAGSTQLTTSTADLVLNEGEACWLPINPDGNLGLVVDGLSATDAFSWMVVGEA